MNQGIFFEDIKVGDKFRSEIGRTITDIDNIWFTLLTNNENQIHFNKDYTIKNYSGPPFNGRLVVNGLLTLSIAIGLSTRYTSNRGIMLAINNVKFLKPVFSGDTIYVEGEIIEKRESRKRPGYGIVRIKNRAINQDGDTVIEFERVIMVPKSGSVWK